MRAVRAPDDVFTAWRLDDGALHHLARHKGHKDPVLRRPGRVGRLAVHFVQRRGAVGELVLLVGRQGPAEGFFGAGDDSVKRLRTKGTNVVRNV